MDTTALYNQHATDWSRSEQLLLSDFTARPRVVQELDPAGAHILDLGCGEGYVARLVAAAGAASVTGIDSSAEMTERARQAIPVNSCPMTFQTLDVVQLAVVGQRLQGMYNYDRAMAVFLFNYLTRFEMTHVMRVVRQRVKSGGRFVFTVPHPCFPYMRPPFLPPFYFDTERRNYFAGVDQTYEGQIWRRDGVAVPVRCVHKTWADYFEALNIADFTRTPKIVELRVTEEHVALDPGFFQPLFGYPLHVLFSVEVP